MPLFRVLLEKINRRVLGANTLRHPNRFSARGISAKRWQQIQNDHELNYWVHEYPTQVPAGKSRREHYHEHYWVVNRNMFKTLHGVFDGAMVVDVGSGPYGSMDYAGSRLVVGIDPLSGEYQKHYQFEPSHIILNAPAEGIPLLDGAADVVISVNALDHMRRPYEALEEMHRICRSGGHFILATDVGGAPDHPCKIEEAHLRAFFAEKKLAVVEQDCGMHIPSGWPAHMQIPLYVFHGIK